MDDYNEDVWIPSVPINLITAEAEVAMSDEERDARMATLDEDQAWLSSLMALLPDDARQEMARVNAEVWADWEAAAA